MELGTPGPMRQHLNALVLSGLKRATAGTSDDYDDEPYEFVGEQLTLVDDTFGSVGVIEVTLVEHTTFAQVPWAFVEAENEGDTSLDEWREGHRRFWQSEGVEVSDDLPVCLIYFTLLDP
jgi:uncharacterized protein YhfF